MMGSNSFNRYGNIGISLPGGPPAPHGEPPAPKFFDHGAAPWTPGFRTLAPVGVAEGGWGGGVIEWDQLSPGDQAAHEDYLKNPPRRPPVVLPPRGSGDPLYNGTPGDEAARDDYVPASRPPVVLPPRGSGFLAGHSWNAMNQNISPQQQYGWGGNSGMNTTPGFQQQAKQYNPGQSWNRQSAAGSGQFARVTRPQSWATQPNMMREY